MVRRPEREKRLADVIGNAVPAKRIATGEIEETVMMLDSTEPLVEMREHPH